ncbi:GNAT family N-acetyltransferase [Stigmatella aurantiaca]|uniref:Acetyltransferase, GNAT family n=1 Tax=Stigmatella aurantiaca (strain DW4/3-1) TaxID=378806 RepID=E3FS16_STIAD|nr:GNAT family N-acetyltransferase [Stigmatella aurantiaca]ADO69551.1 Acetyltransferase, GNAT family [Stigmatella aurantiaca DW4/3-1]
MIAPGPRLETPRLLLRPTATEDLEGFVTLAGDPESAHFIGGVQPPSMAWRAMNVMAGSWTLQGFSMFSVVEKKSGRWIGRVGPWRPEGWPGTEVGWGLLRPYWGQGYATEAAAAAITWAFDQLGWHEVIHCIAPENTPSQQVARRLGSQLKGPGKLPAPYDTATMEVWGQDRDTWRARHGQG